MKKAFRELRRRPLLTPIWLFGLAAVVAAALVAVFVSHMTTTTVVVVRHAEKEFGTIENPPLSTAGEQRAQLLARLFGERVGSQTLAAVFATESRTTQSTAAPLAARLRLPVTVVPVKETDGLLQRIRSEYRGRSVLIVGDVNTVPDIVRHLSKVSEVPALRESDFSSIYIVTLPTLGRPSLLQMRY